MAQDEDTRRMAVAREALINDPDFLRSIVESTVQRLLEYGITEHLQAGPYERTDARKGHRNGYKPRAPSRRACSMATIAARKHWWSA